MPQAIDAPPWMLQIARETLHPGGEDQYREIEEDAARICAELGCPNAHLAVESLTRPPKGSAEDPSSPLAGSSVLSPRFARPGPLNGHSSQGSQREPNPR